MLVKRVSRLSVPVQAEYGDKEDMQPVTQRTLTHWAKALCIRAALAEHAQVHPPASGSCIV